MRPVADSRSKPAYVGTTVRPCIASPRLPRIIDARRLALPSSDMMAPSIFS